MDKKIISFASDFGLSDGSVGIVKGVINRIDPELLFKDYFYFSSAISTLRNHFKNYAKEVTDRKSVV